MSASSSTTSTSSAINYTFVVVVLGVFSPFRGERRELVGIECDADVGPAARAIEKGDLAHMLLDDFLDDRQAQPGAAHARRHIGLGQAFAILGQPDACIEHVDDQLVALAPEAQIDAIAGQAVLAASLPAFNG